MGGLAVLLILLAYLGASYAIVKAIRARAWKVGVVVLLVLIPTADAVLGRIYLEHLCRTEAGTAIHRAVTGVEGFLAEIPDQSWIQAYGYRFSEGVLQGTDRVNRFIRRNGQVDSEWGSAVVLSAYRVRTVSENGARLFPRQRTLVEDLKTGEVLAERTQISFRGGWLELLLGQFTDSGPGDVAWCEMELSAHERWNRNVAMILQTLAPKQ